MAQSTRKARVRKPVSVRRPKRLDLSAESETVREYVSDSFISFLESIGASVTHAARDMALNKAPEDFDHLRELARAIILHCDLAEDTLP